MNESDAIGAVIVQAQFAKWRAQTALKPRDANVIMVAALPNRLAIMGAARAPIVILNLKTQFGAAPVCALNFADGAQFGLRDFGKHFGPDARQRQEIVPNVIMPDDFRGDLFLRRPQFKAHQLSGVKL